jgi:CheY-like chemotaxis protein
VRGDIQIMRDAQTNSFRERFLRRRQPLAAPGSAAQPVVTSSPALALAAEPVPVDVAVSAPEPVLVDVAVSAPEPVLVDVAVSAPEPAIPNGKRAASVLSSFGTRVLVIASDRRFRAVAATLLTQRGYVVAVGGRGEDIAELAVRERADVVIIDASASLTVAAREAARLGSLRPRVGVVAVSDGSGHGLAALPVLPKWSSFDEVFEAIDRVRADGARAGATRVAT